MKFNMKKAMIYDLDNTLYAVSDIGHELFAPLFDRIERSDNYSEDMDKIKKDLMRKPYQEVAEIYGFDEELKRDGDDILKELTYEKEIQVFEDYPALKELTYEKEIQVFEDYPAILELPGDRYLVTTGYTNMQNSKIRNMGISNDFKDLIVVDPSISDLTKMDVFSKIMKENGYQPSEMMVIGDDPDSEIKAAAELGIETVLYHKLELTDHPHADYIIKDFRELASILTGQAP